MREGDNAYHLAEVFARAMKLDKSYIKKLALLIQMQVKDYNRQHSLEATAARKRGTAFDFGPLSGAPTDR